MRMYSFYKGLRDETNPFTSRRMSQLTPRPAGTEPVNIQDHPLRYDLANELHARPFPVVQAPAHAVYLALSRGQGAPQDQDLAHLKALLDRFGAPHPQPDATHYSANLGRFTLKWESHTEFVSYTIFSDGVADRPFDPRTFEVFPAEWLAAAPGQRLTSALIRVERMTDTKTVKAKLVDWFVGESLAAAWVLDKNAIVAGDFRIDSGGHMRFGVFVAADTGPRRVGRIVQRLCEIETYKTMAMLGLHVARGLSQPLGVLDKRLSDLTVAVSTGTEQAEENLHALMDISSELERLLAQSSFRFSGTKAYEAIVTQRIEVLRETRLNGRQSFQEFMTRRFDPAMRTVQSTEQRLNSMAERATRAGNLLRARVDVDRAAQNQALLTSMDRRADLQLRLQHTVEGLSVVAISYYAVNLASYLTYPILSGLGLSKNQSMALLVLPVIGGVAWMVRRIKQHID